MNFKKGFTLIELLIMIAVIGILTGITFGYIGETKIKGSDSSVKSNLGTVRSVAEIFYLNNASSYLPAGGEIFNIGICPGYNTEGTNMFSKNSVIANAIANATFNGNNSSCYNSANKWAVAIGLKSNTGTSWCVDSQGAGRVVRYDALGAISPVTFNCN